jgi:hypothetical protein
LWSVGEKVSNATATSVTNASHLQRSPGLELAAGSGAAAISGWPPLSASLGLVVTLVTRTLAVERWRR